MGQGESDNVIGDRLLLVDGHAYAYRAFHAIRQLTSPDGKPTNAIFGFIRMLGKMMETLKPSHVAVVWDGGLAAERVSRHPSYKAQRPPMPSDLDSQMTGIVDYLDAARIPSLCRNGVEADDWIAALALCAARDGLNVVIASSDKDFMQLVGPRVGLLKPNDKAESVWTDANVRATTGVAPEQIVDWLSLVGDSVDNIPGVPGVGPKTATELLCRFESVEQLYSRLDEVESPRLRAKLGESRRIVERNQELIRLHSEVVGDCDISSLRAGPPDVPRLLRLLAGWGFRTLRKEIEEVQCVQHELF